MPIEKFDVLNTFTGAVQFTAEIECEVNTLRAWKLRLAVLWAVKHKSNLSGSDLSGSDLSGSDLYRSNLSRSNLSRSNLSRSNLSGSDLSGSNLYRSDLSGSDLSGSNLSRSNLSRSNLSRSNLSRSNLSRSNLSWLVQGATRSDGYEFKLLRFKDEPVKVVAGCRNFTITEAHKHWNQTRKNTPLGNETFAIIDNLIELAKLRGYEVK